nr:hypothetical protein [Tanacetum cinerariifolium]
MQDELSVEITHGAKGRVLTDVSAYKPSAEADYHFDLQWSGGLRKILSIDRRSALRDIFVPLSEPLSVMALKGTKNTFNVIPATVDTTTALSVTSVSASLIPLISTDDYEIAHAKGGESAGLDANPFPNFDDVELNTS